MGLVDPLVMSTPWASSPGGKLPWHLECFFIDSTFEPDVEDHTIRWCLEGLHVLLAVWPQWRYVETYHAPGHALHGTRLQYRRPSEEWCGPSWWQ